MDFIKAAGLYKGIVIDTNDPSGKFHRIRVRIPQFHGLMNTKVIPKQSSSCDKTTMIYVEDSCLPWCEVAFPYGSDFTPEVGQVVVVGFFNSNTSQPVVLGWLGYEYTDKENSLRMSSIDI
jgi:uncharacterized protein involved in type VI secretion and phage assembly